MAEIRRHLDPGSLLVIVITLALFAAAVFFKGFTHDLLLEAGVFLVSVKLIIMSYEHSVATHTLEERLAEMHALLRRLTHQD